MERLTQLQKQHNLPVHSLIQDVVTRWDSTFLMLHRLVELKVAVNAYCVQHKYELLLSEAEWKTVEKAHDFLRPFTELNKVLCRDSSPLSMQIAAGRTIANELAVSKAFGALETYKIHAVAHLLDPRFKDAIVNPESVADFRLNATAWIGQSVEAGDVDNAEVRALTDSPPAKKRSFLDTLRNKLLSGGAQASASSSSQPAARRLNHEAELQTYLRQPLADWEGDPLVYWSQNERAFPACASVARRFLSAPATSVASEQIFSVVKVVFDPRRCRLTPKKAEMLVFLNRNLPVLDYKY